KVGLRDNENCAFDAEEMKNIEMLFRLRHDAVVGSNREKCEIDTVRTRKHVADETLVPRHIDDARAASVGQIEMSKTEVDGDASLFLFFETVCILAGQGFDQTRLAVIDVSCSSDDV